MMDVALKIIAALVIPAVLIAIGAVIAHESRALQQAEDDE